jgi:putative addiction module killer protein
VVEVRQTSEFKTWLRDLRDTRAKARILARIDRLALGNAGDHKAVGEGVMELRIPYGPGYRVYYRQRGDIVVVLLCGGDKDSQRADIKLAHYLARREG